MEQPEVILGHHTLLPFRQLQFEHRRVPIGNKALQILSTLAAAKGNIVTKFELMDIVWSGLIVDENALHVHVAALRRALGSDAGLLITVRGLGYRLDRDFAENMSAKYLHQYRSIAVLAFLNMTGNPTMDYLGEGISEELINSLSRRPALKIPSRTSSFAFKHRYVDARLICEKLGVDALVEGSVRIAGGRARVTAQLIEGCNGSHVWSENLDHEFANLFDLQGDIAMGIMRSLERFLYRD